MPGSGLGVIADIAAQLEPARDLLRVLALNPGPQRKVGRAAEHEVESLVGGQRNRVPEVRVADLIAVAETVVRRRLPGQAHALLLRLDSNHAGSSKAPGGHHPHRADAGSEIEHEARRRNPCGAVPRREQVVCGKTMPLPKLKDSEMTADRVQGFVRRHLDLASCAGRNRPRLHPSFEERFNSHVPLPVATL